MKISPIFDPKSACVLYQGDCLDLLKTIPNGFAKLVVTSPPYNLGKPYETRLDIEDYLNQQKEIIRESVRVLHDEGSICWQVGNYVSNKGIIPLDIVLYPIFTSLGLHLRNRIVWHFAHGLHATKRFSGRYEVILWFTKSESYTFNLDAIRVPQKYPNKKYFKGPRRGELSGNPLGKNPGDIWDIPNVKANHVEKTLHPCQFPVELIERLVLSMTNEGDWVLDPFMGVGSAAIAALIHGRKAIGAEIMPEYVNIARERIEKAENGELRIRPMDRPVFDPTEPTKNIPPKVVDLKKRNSLQPRLLESKATYKTQSED
ncbi:MAG: site-specific DNA-methyltransferase [Anaerolineales bacterium]|jgi:adenine-specific DNA-methyltransferase|nr:site-specific DNA-methyltransferase [Chloroflexota bacterium]MCZ7547849.1 site-specific DNA-methyltransferase [Anaerolineales bacterium]GER78779.1 DNA methyltransferase [Candidatus Denitrolinea symbiosum]MDX9937554.1 site-specific DNA-methyltransferase [Anaerolineales bacterium]NOG76204.1 site-specific DNA-methyltransferase [Chloroflexota bacterium]